MKLIETFKSPNFNERAANQQLSYLILHYTAMASCKEALEHVCDKKNKVSAHFMVSKIGDICIDLYSQNKIATVIKHMPGHGLTKTDSHFRTPIIRESNKILDKIDFSAFKNKK